MNTALVRFLAACALLACLSVQAGGSSLSLSTTSVAPAAACVFSSAPANMNPASCDTRPTRQKVGEEVAIETIQTRHPYQLAHQAVLTREIHLPGASYIAPYFSRFDLAPGDWLIVRSPDGKRQWRYEGEGKPGRGLSGGFWGIHIPGDRAIIELHGSGNSEGWGYRIDKVARGFALDDDPPSPICGEDDKLNARCYETSHPLHYDQSRAVLRLLTSGMYLCTGWLLGPDGHVMTNGHCIENAQEAQDTVYEAMAEGSCSQTCSTLECPGDIISNHGMLIRRNYPDLDYALIKLDANPPAEYGYLKLRQQASHIGELLYIPQHPQGWGKQIALHSTYPDDPTGFPQVQAVWPDSLLYFADINYGSSGSPVLSHDDHCVIALHYGALGCEEPIPGNHNIGNLGKQANLIIADLGPDAPPGSIAWAGEACAELPYEVLFEDRFESL